VFQETCAGYNDLLMDLQDDYPSGQAFRTNSRTDGCVLLGGSWLGVDLIFTIDFCDTTTPVRRETWGKLKVLYR
jgi:hypothetical protein